MRTFAMAQTRGRGKTIEETYQKKTQLEHILLRPDSYVGSIEQQQDTLWVWDQARGKMVNREIKFVPGLYKIFDEILVNACDNLQRDKTMSKIQVTIDPEEGFIEVENDGKTLPVEVHKEHKMYVPEMVFGHLLTSDNYDDDEKKVTGGRNGYGAKLTNIFSTKFSVECGDGQRQKRFLQVWTENMGKKDKQSITKFSGKDFTRVRFYPDLAKFGMTKLDKNIVSLMQKRVIDAAGSTGKRCKVYLNGELVPVTNLKDYVNLYFDSEDQVTAYESNDRWEVAVSVSDGQFQQVSFVNSINTTKGGTHVNHVTEQFTSEILRKVSSKNKGGMDIKPFHVRNHLWVFVNCLIENPAFDSQTKDTLTLKASKFGSKYEVSDGMIGRVVKTGIIDLVLQWAKAKESIDLSKKIKGSKSKRILGIPKLEDANLAGTKESATCTLILTEGDSAKSLAVAGLSVVGRDRYGVFPLRGKPLNVRDASFTQSVNNIEMQNMIKIMGLSPKQEYSDVNSLRYGSVMIMADQDFDGSHIKGLLLNMIQHWWPSLFRLRGFLKEFVTPIVKATRRGEEVQFFTVREYERWKHQTRDEKGWHTKYYKGLGTSTSTEAKQYFRNLAEHSLMFQYKGPEDEEAIDLAFNKKRADDRKVWINDVDESECIDHSQEKINYSDFVHKELVHFAKYDVLRAIPSMVDGFKPTQRKIIFCCFKRGLKSDVKVAQLAGYVSEHSAYHHGESSLQGTIVTMAQDYVGSNNVNLLTPSGQFGTRLQGGKDAASARYIYTRLEPVTRMIFHPDDDALLEYQDEEGQSIEPTWYIPVIPMALVNGAEGIGTGWSSSLPNFNPRDIIANLKKFIRKKPMDALVPFYKGFKGSISEYDADAATQGYQATGVVERTDDGFEITELPIRKWTQDYKEFLQGMVEDEKGAKLQDFTEHHTESTVHFAINATKAQAAALEKVEGGLEKSFKLRSGLSTNNMVFFDKDGKIKRYETNLEMLEAWANLRLEYYGKRKTYLVGKLEREKDILSEKARFIRMVIKGEIQIGNRKKAQLIVDLRSKNFRPMRETKEGPALVALEVAKAGVDDGDDAKGFNYLLSMPIWSLTKERVEALEKELAEKKQDLDKLVATKIEDIWERDLNAVLKELDVMEQNEDERRKEDARLRKKGVKTPVRKQKGLRKRPRADADSPAAKKSRLADEEDEPMSAPVAKEESVADLLASLQARQKARAAMKLPDLA